MSATLTTVNGILKEVYEGDINDQLDTEAVTIKRIERSSDGVVDTVGGKYVVFPVRHTRNAGISYRAENGQLASAGRQGFSAAQESLKYGYGRVRLTGQLIALAEKNYQAFASAMDQEMEGLKADLVDDQNRIAVGHTSGVAGVAAALTATSSGTTITVDSTINLQKGMVIDITNAGTPVSGGTARTISSITSATAFEVDSSVAGATNGNYVSRTGNYGNEPYGLSSLIGSTGTVHNINSATAGNEYWKSVVDSSTSTLTELSMITVCDTIRRNCGGKPSVVLTSLGVRRAYFNLMTGLRKYNEPKEWTGGLVGLAFNYGKEIPVVEDPDIHNKQMYFLDEKELSIYRDREWHWEDTSGSVLQWVSDYDAFEALIKCYWQLVTHKRGAHGKMTNITEA